MGVVYYNHGNRKMTRQFESRICLWEDLSLTDTEKLQKCGSSVNAVQKTLRDILGITSEDKQTMIELDLYAYALLFARSNNFSTPQMSAFFTILKSIHRLCISSPFDNQEQALELLNNLLIRHGVTRPPYSMALFSLKQVKTITDYILSSYFKHYKLYKYAFTKRVRLDLKILYDAEECGDKDSVCEDKQDETKSEIEEQPEVDSGQDEATVSPQEDEHSEIQQSEEDTGYNELRDIVSSTLSKKLKDLEVSIEHEMTSHDHKLSERIDALEQLVGEKTKQKKSVK